MLLALVHFNTLLGFGLSRIGSAMESRSVSCYVKELLRLVEYSSLGFAYRARNANDLVILRRQVRTES